MALLENTTNEREIIMKKLLTLLSALTLALVCAFSVSAEETEQAPYIFWDKEPYTEDETTKIIDHVVYRLCNMAVKRTTMFTTGLILRRRLTQLKKLTSFLKLTESK